MVDELIDAHGELLPAGHPGGAREYGGASDGRDPHAGVLKRGDRSGVGAGVGDQLVDLGQLADPRERDLADLRAVGDDRDLVRPDPISARLVWASIS